VKLIVFADSIPFPAKSLIPVDKVAVYLTERLNVLLGVNVAVVVLAELLSVLTTIPEKALLELSTKVNVLLVIVELELIPAIYHQGFLVSCLTVKTIFNYACFRTWFSAS